MRAHIVPHTHWDREWYLTFQEFRFKLVRLVDSLLEIMEQDPEYRYFTLDGQAIILEDYLEIRPENRPPAGKADPGRTHPYRALVCPSRRILR